MPRAHTGFVEPQAFVVVAQRGGRGAEFRQQPGQLGHDPGLQRVQVRRLAGQHPQRTRKGAKRQLVVAHLATQQRKGALGGGKVGRQPGFADPGRPDQQHRLAAAPGALELRDLGFAADKRQLRRQLDGAVRLSRCRGCRYRRRAVHGRRLAQRLSQRLRLWHGLQVQLGRQQRATALELAQGLFPLAGGGQQPHRFAVVAFLQAVVLQQLPHARQGCGQVTPRLGGRGAGLQRAPAQRLRTLAQRVQPGRITRLVVTLGRQAFQGLAAPQCQRAVGLAAGQAGLGVLQVAGQRRAGAQLVAFCAHGFGCTGLAQANEFSPQVAPGTTFVLPGPEPGAQARPAEAPLQRQQQQQRERLARLQRLRLAGQQQAHRAQDLQFEPWRIGGRHALIVGAARGGHCSAQTRIRRRARLRDAAAPARQLEGAEELEPFTIRQHRAGVPTAVGVEPEGQQGRGRRRHT